MVALSTLLLLPLFFVGAETVKAQTTQDEGHSFGLSVSSPINITYSSNSLLLNASAIRMFDPSWYTSQLMYSLDGKANITLQSTVTFHDMSIPNITFSGLASYTIIKGAAYLSNLSEGPHYLTVYGIYLNTGLARFGPAVMHDNQTIYFMINDGAPPVIEMLQIQNKTYQTSLPLNFSVDELVSWMGYSLDQQHNVTLDGNATLNGLAYGSHSLVVYANDTAGNMGSTGNIEFIVAKLESFPVVFISIAAVVVVAVAAVIGAGLLVYFKKHKRQKQLI